jgi:Flp pilus assembly protein TadD
MQGNYQQALSDLREAVSLEPRNTRALINRGVVHGRLGDLAAAKRDFEAALALAPRNPVAQSNLAGLEPEARTADAGQAA